MGQGLSKRVFLRRRSSAVLRSYDLTGALSGAGIDFRHEQSIAAAISGYDDSVIMRAVIMRSTSRYDRVAGKPRRPVIDKSKGLGTALARQGLSRLF